MSILYSALTVIVSIAALAALALLLPTGHLPDNVTTALTTTFTYIKAWGFFVDYAILFTVAGTIVLIEFWILTFKVLMWLFRMILKQNA